MHLESQETSSLVELNSCSERYAGCDKLPHHWRAITALTLLVCNRR